MNVLVVTAHHDDLESRIKRINTWLNPAEKCWLWLEKAGFRPTVPLKYFGTVNIRFEPITHQMGLFFPNWNIQIADSDVFLKKIDLRRLNQI